MTRAPDEGRDAFADFVRPHWEPMARLARRLAPPGQWEDVLQEALSAAWRKRAQYDQSRGTARSWLLAIIADQAYKGHRRAVRRRDEPFDDAGGERGDGPALDTGVDVRRLVSRLSRRQRIAVELYYYLGIPVDEVAAVMACSAGTVKSTLADARTRLRCDLGEDYR